MGSASPASSRFWWPWRWLACSSITPTSAVPLPPLLCVPELPCLCLVRTPAIAFGPSQDNRYYLLTSPNVPEHDPTFHWRFCAPSCPPSVLMEPRLWSSTSAVFLLLSSGSVPFPVWSYQLDGLQFLMDLPPPSPRPTGAPSPVECVSLVEPGPWALGKTRPCLGQSLAIGLTSLAVISAFPANSPMT